MARMMRTGRSLVCGASSAAVRRNYFRLYFHYVYFNIGRIAYLQADDIFGYIILGPAIVSAAITLGLMQQILNVFERVRTSFQYLVNAWPTIVKLLWILQAPARTGGRAGAPAAPMELQTQPSA